MVLLSYNCKEFWRFKKYINPRSFNRVCDVCLWKKNKSKMASQYRSIVWVLNLEFRCTKPLSQDLRMAGHVPGSSTSSSVTEGRIFSVFLTKKKQSKPKRGPTSGFHFLFQSCIFSSPGFCLRALVAVLQRYFDVQISKIYHPFSHF